MKNERLFSIVSIFSMMTLSVVGQSNFGTPIDSLCNNRTVDGERLINKKNFRHFAILFRDTCVSLNRFTYCYFQSVRSGQNKNFRLCPNDYYYPALQINLDFVNESERCLLTWMDTVSKSIKREFRHTRRRSFYHYIRCYGGFIDEVGCKNIVIQFLTRKEFFRNQSYKFCFDLFALRKTSKLRFLIIKIQPDRTIVDSFFL